MMAAAARAQPAMRQGRVRVWRVHDVCMARAWCVCVACAWRDDCAWGMRGVCSACSSEASATLPTVLPSSCAATRHELRPGREVRCGMSAAMGTSSRPVLHDSAAASTCSEGKRERVSERVRKGPQGAVRGCKELQGKCEGV